jgi:tetratricopeptide (TPR) repeat protein
VTVEYSHMMAAAERRTAHRDWGEAARSYEAAADLAVRSGSAEPAWRAWTAAGECWRRDDRPIEAERCLRRALELTEPAGTAAAATVPPLAAVLGDLGAAELAEDLLESVAAEQAPGALLAPLHDTRAGLLVGLGRKEAARVQVQSLRGCGKVADLPVRFRDAQLLALDGELGRARTAWRRLVATLHRGGEPAGVGAALSALGDVELLLGAEREAMLRYQAAAEAWEAAGRRAPAWFAHAGRVRAMVALGVHPLPAMLEEGIAFAEDRGMIPLASALRTARGAALAEHAPDRARADLERALEDAMTVGLPLQVGQAAYELATRLCLPETQQQNLLETAAMAFVSHVPLAARVALARARLLARFDAVQARTVARSCVPLLERMGMARDLVAARALVRHLG